MFEVFFFWGGVREQIVDNQTYYPYLLSQMGGALLVLESVVWAEDALFSLALPVRVEDRGMGKHGASFGETSVFVWGLEALKLQSLVAGATQKNHSGP